MISLKAQRADAPLGLPLVAAFVLGIFMALLLQQVCEVQVTTALVAAAIIGSALGAAALPLMKWRKWAPWVLLGVVLLACIALHSLLIGGFAWFVQGAQHHDFILSGHFRMPVVQANEGGASVVLGLFAGVFSCISAFANRRGTAIWPLFLAAMLVAAVLSGFATLSTGLVLAIAGVVLCAVACSQSRLQIWQRGSLWKNLLAGLALLLVLTGLGAAAATAFDFQNASVHEVIEQAQENAELSGRALNHGNLSANQELALSTNAALDVTVGAGEAETLYLRGYTGETYEDGAWHVLDRSVVEAFGEQALWLDDETFSSQGQLAQASAQTKLKTGTSTAYSLKNTGAASGLYLPYCYQSSEDLTLSSVPSWQLAKGNSNSYSATVLLGATHKAYLIQDALSKAGSDDDYAEQENVYAAFAKEAYTQVPEDVEKALTTLLGKKEALDVDQVKYLISAYLDEYFCYDTSPSAATQDTDPLVWFAADGRSGYSQQYASLAVMILRHYGIAARYVEGYYVQLPDREKSTTVSVTENDAHAWAEYYMDGVGWVPFDVTPGYGDDENFYDTTDNTTTTDDPKLQGVLDRINKVVSPWKPQVLTQDDSGVSDETVPTNKEQPPSYAGLAILIVVLLLVAALLARIVWARRRLSRLRAAITDQGNAAVALGFSYLVFLCKMYFGCAFENGPCEQWAAQAFEKGACGEEAFRVAARANEKALFSSVPCDEKDNRAVLDALEQTQALLRSQRKGIMKIWDRLIMGRY